MDTWIERRVRSLCGLRRKRAGDQRGLEQALSLEQSSKRIGTGKLGAIEQRQPFLRAKRQRSKARLRKRICGGGFAIRNDDLANTNHRRGKMRERGKIARSPDRTLGRDYRRQPFGQHRLKQGNRCRLHPRRPLCKTRQFERHHQAGDRHGHSIAYARRMAQHNVALKRFKISIADFDRRQLPEACVDSVHWLMPGEDAANSSGTFGNCGPTRRIKRRNSPIIERAPIGQRNRAR